MQTDAKLAAFEITTREDVMHTTEVEIHARFIVRTDGLVAAVEEAPIKSLIENGVCEWVRMEPKSKGKGVAK